MKNPKITLEEIGIIKRAQKGDKKAFNQLFKKYKDFVDNLLYTYIGDWDEARDITNIVFLKMREKLPKFVTYDSFGGWLRILTKNTAIDYLRTVRSNHVSIDDTEKPVQLRSSRIDSEISQVDKMAYENILDLVMRYPPLYRKVFMMYYVDDIGVEEIGETQGIPVGTVKSILYRMRKQIKQQLKIK